MASLDDYKLMVVDSRTGWVQFRFLDNKISVAKYKKEDEMA